MPFSPRFMEALAYAATLHNDQLRKGTDIPYVSHLLAVSALAIEHGADEETAIAALLHDAIEDQGAGVRIPIREKFGPRVLAIVEGCTDTDVHPKPPWRQRKEAYLKHLRQADESTRLVSACDKVHNARAILRDFESVGTAVWERFNAGACEQAWYYGSLARELSHGIPPALSRELASLAARIKDAAAETSA